MIDLSVFQATINNPPLRMYSSFEESCFIDKLVKLIVYLFI